MVIVKRVLLVGFAVVFLSSCKKDSGSGSNSSDSNVKDSLKGETALYKDDNTEFDYLPASTTNQIVKHDYYTLSYNEKFEQAEWVAYELKKSYIKNNDFKRPYFNEDPKVTTGSADWRNYKKSGYDKGHLCPAGDMEFDKKAYEDTFLTSNISPQIHEFNDGVWNRLEQKVRYWAVKYDDIYVVTGGVLTDSNTTIGKEKVLVPKYFYKVLLDESNGKYKMIAFLVPNEKSERPLYEFVVSVDSIEKLTGIDFFPHLDDKIEDSLEKNKDYKAWAF
ncbi:endonuclease [Flavobacterium sp. KMS]|uniref:DNA/RNA non-specific endonuclease n=1 Tax=Flavobacterium sp. KMS TaxID=1566023 RepID=UPI00057CC059|nr:DNA/RNA non-specific endonuclease [Flavobacterium sp. KMS]KIA99035.1 endonuclease [Flavobacterium sp. KMS]